MNEATAVVQVLRQIAQDFEEGKIKFYSLNLHNIIKEIESFTFDTGNRTLSFELKYEDLEAKFQVEEKIKKLRGI